MKTIKLGELEVSTIGLGCMGMSQAYGEADPAESERTLNRALDIGVTFLDTASKSVTSVLKVRMFWWFSAVSNSPFSFTSNTATW